MVDLNSVRESNVNLRSTARGQIALFVGATNGIAGYTLTEYTRKSNRPEIYIVGRNYAKLSRIIRELETINPEGSYLPILSEISLIKNVDAACSEFKIKENRLDLLLMCPGYIKLSQVEQRQRLRGYNLPPLLCPHAFRSESPTAPHIHALFPHRQHPRCRQRRPPH